jgi:hypothetical protein
VRERCGRGRRRVGGHAISLAGRTHEGKFDDRLLIF